MKMMIRWTLVVGAAALLPGCPVEVSSTEWSFTGKETITVAAWQGIASDGTWWYFSGPLAALHRAGPGLAVVSSNWMPIPIELVLTEGINHIGDIDVAGGYIYAPYEVVGLESIFGNQGGLAIYDAETLDLVTYSLIPTSVDDAAGWCAVDPSGTLLYVGAGTVSEVYAYSLSALAAGPVYLSPVATLALSQEIERSNGAAFYGGYLYVTTNDSPKRVYKVDPATGATSVSVTVYAEGEMEGIAFRSLPSGEMHFAIMPVTGSSSTPPSDATGKLYHLQPVP